MHCPKVGTRYPFVAVRCPLLAMRQVFGQHSDEQGAMPDPLGAIRSSFEPMPNPFAAMPYAKETHRP